MSAASLDREIEVRIVPEIWAQEVERLRPDSPARIAAERERPRLESRGLRLTELVRCDTVGSDGTRLPGMLKVYVPISSDPASTRPFGFVLSPGLEHGRPYLALVAFGERHPARGTRAVYERAHKRLHGRFPDQERARPPVTTRSPQARSPSLAIGHHDPARGGLER